ncbi:hypothetical protein PRIPAC_88269 [Pristionchus pacificus]|uniref:Uncharacterized protein n=1 Tax=Pristionchus pacificus TaxID=54126 RepID=A0A2A6B7A2_PRIPA|nr:hypothetical protein PRIPAC_88269 [Pristionchus pacificus]|eukprot:PDM61755.1 hypothetical protein PRIPAC_51197 [Pristionchus pacificus]
MFPFLLLQLAIVAVRPLLVSADFMEVRSRSTRAVASCAKQRGNSANVQSAPNDDHRAQVCGGADRVVASNSTTIVTAAHEKHMNTIDGKN